MAGHLGIIEHVLREARSLGLVSYNSNLMTTDHILATYKVHKGD